MNRLAGDQLELLRRWNERTTRNAVPQSLRMPPRRERTTDVSIVELTSFLFNGKGYEK